MIVGMKHAGAQVLEVLEPLLAQLRQLPELTEKRPGVFYRKSRAFLHFHEDPAGLFADVRRVQSFERFEVTTPAQQADLLRRVRDAW
jgi:hypothetical protein